MALAEPGLAIPSSVGTAPAAGQLLVGLFALYEERALCGNESLTPENVTTMTSDFIDKGRVIIIERYFQKRWKSKSDFILQGLHGNSPYLFETFGAFNTLLRMFDGNAGGVFYTLIVIAVITISVLMAFSLIVLLVQADHWVIKAASGRILTLYVLLLLCQLWYSVAIIVDPEDDERLCTVQPILQCIGAVGTSSVLFLIFRDLLHNPEQ